MEDLSHELSHKSANTRVDGKPKLAFQGWAQRPHRNHHLMELGNYITAVSR
jgi:hypothetical protein